MKVKRITLLAIVACLILVVGPAAHAYRTWGLSLDWPATTGGGVLPLPAANGQWSYGYGKNFDVNNSALPFTYTQFENTISSGWGQLANGVYQPADTYTPFVGANRGNAWGGQDIPLGKVGGHDSVDTPKRPAVFRWTCPSDISGYVSITAMGWIAYVNLGDASGREFNFVVRKISGSTVTQICDVHVPWVMGVLQSTSPTVFGPEVVEVTPNDIIEYFAYLPNPPAVSGAGIKAYDITIQEVPASAQAPTFSPTPGSRSYSTYVSMHSAEPGAVIHYTTDGSEPTSASPVYSAPIRVTTSANFKAKAMVAGLGDSTTTTGTYTVTGSATSWHLSDWQDSVLPARGIGPDGTWSFGYANPTTFVAWPSWGGWWLGTGYIDNTFSEGPGMSFHVDPSTEGLIFGPNSVLMHTPSGGAPLIIRWTAPASMTVNMNLAAQASSDQGPGERLQDCGLKLNGTSIWVGPQLDQPATEPATALTLNNVDVRRGDTYDFYFSATGTGNAVAANNFDITPVGGERTATPVMTPVGGIVDAVQHVTMTCADAGADIRYTTNGSEPTVTSTPYSGPVTISDNTTLKAKAFASGLAASNTATEVYQFKASQVVFGPKSHERHYSTYITMSSTAGATIKYTTDGSDPKTSGTAQTYTAPVFTKVDTTFKAYATYPAYAASDVTQATYTFNSTGAEWHLTGDWLGVGTIAGQVIPPSDPVLPSTEIGPDNAWAYGYHGAGGTGPYGFKVFDAFQTGAWFGQKGYVDSTNTNTFGGPAMRTPYNSNGPDFYYGEGAIFFHDMNPYSEAFEWTAPASLTVSMSGSANMATEPPDYRPHTIAIRKNGDAPVWTGLTDHSWVTASFSGFTMNVNRGDKIYLTSTPSATGNFVSINSWDITPLSAEKTALPVFSPDGGTYAFSKLVTISCPEPEATVYYTTDGSTPTISSPSIPYGSTAQVWVSSTMTLKAKAQRTGLDMSDVKSSLYTINNCCGSWSLTDEYESGKLPAAGIGSDGVWSYGYDTVAGEGPFSFQAWRESGNYWGGGGYKDEAFFGAGVLYGISHPSAASNYVSPGDLVFPANCVLMHTNANADQPLLFKWTAPATTTISMAGACQVAGDYSRNDLQPARWHEFGIRKNAENNAWNAISVDWSHPVSFTGLTMDVNRGDSVYLWIRRAAISPGFASVNSWTVQSVGGERSASPAFSVPGGAYFGPQVVSITSVDPGATIRFTLNGSEPTTSSTTYTGPITISANMTLKAKAWTALPVSNTTTATYTFTSATTVPDVKSKANGVATGISAGVVTAVFDSSTFYVEDINRTSGIRVQKAYHGAIVGNTVDVAGQILTDSNGERYINATTVTTVGTGTVAPLALNNKAVGGGAFQLQEGVAGGNGLNTIGLLVKAWGTITKVAGSTTDYMLSDGSGVDLKINVVPFGILQWVPTPPTSYPDGTFVSVTGICSCEKVGTDIKRVIKVTGSDVIPTTP